MAYIEYFLQRILFKFLAAMVVFTVRDCLFYRNTEIIFFPHEMTSEAEYGFSPAECGKSMSISKLLKYEIYGDSSSLAPLHLTNCFAQGHLSRTALS